MKKETFKAIAMNEEMWREHDNAIKGLQDARKSLLNIIIKFVYSPMKAEDLYKAAEIQEIYDNIDEIIQNLLYKER